jgi:UDP-N-acetylglucosamine--N-acetylmuramyl-(pentapeptide) pyrophosphoryl-undecaprenol N-acetylglucosamine transferase
MIKTIALSWGGTWWHIFPLLSLYNFLKEEENYRFIWIWEEFWLEEKIAQKNQIKFLSLSTGKLRRYFDLKNFYEPFKNMTWVIQALYYIKKYNIDIVFSKGWYVSVPVCIAAKILGKKIYIHESDIITWLSNKFISKFATKIFYSFPHSLVDGQKHILSGQILNPELIDNIESIEKEENEILHILVIAWSQGSTIIFKSLLSILDTLQDIDFTIILWEKNLHFRENFSRFSNVTLYDMISQEDLGQVYKDTDIAITRAWATTLFELYYFGIHSIIIPLKSSAWHHQEKNALFFKENFLSDMLDEDEDLSNALWELLQKYKNLRKIWVNIENFFEPLNIIKKHL